VQKVATLLLKGTDCVSIYFVIERGLSISLIGLRRVAIVPPRSCRASVAISQLASMSSTKRQFDEARYADPR